MSSLALLQLSPLASESSPWVGYLKVFGFLAALLCFCYFLLRVLGRRVSGLRDRGPGGHLELIDRLALEPRRTVYVLRAGEHYIAIASTESGMQVLLELSAKTFAQASGESTGKGKES
jgi:flagellar protein FliO/FliZ